MPGMSGSIAELKKKLAHYCRNSSLLFYIHRTMHVVIDRQKKTWF